MSTKPDLYNNTKILNNVYDENLEILRTTQGIGEDKTGRISVNTIFGDKIIGQRVPQLAAQFQYPLATDDASYEISGGTIYQDNSMLMLETTGSTIGNNVSVFSTSNLRYIPGHEVYAYYTIIYNTPIENQNQFTGILDNETGFGCGYSGLTFGFIHRRDYSTRFFPIDLEKFNLDNGYDLNLQRGNIFRLTYGFLGFANCRLEIVTECGSLALLYNYKYPNNNIEVHLNQTFLPLRAELDNNIGNTPMMMKIGSISAGIVDGSLASTYAFSRNFTHANTDAIIINTNTELIAFRNKDLFGGRKNYVQARLMQISGDNDLNKNARWFLIKNPTIINTPTWTDIDVDSIMEHSTDIEIDFINSTDYFLAWNTQKIGDFYQNVDNMNLDLPPNGVACFYLSTDGVGEADLSIRWSELF